MKKRLVAVALLVGLLWGSRAFAQSRPLVTQDPETVSTGQILVEAGLDFDKEAFYPASGLLGNRWRVGTVGFSFGVSTFAEIQLGGGLRDHLSITSRRAAPLSDLVNVPGTSTTDIEDAVIGAKIRFLSETEGRPAMAVRFSTRLPIASTASGLGLHTTDFNLGIAIGKTVQSLRVVGNVGIGSLGDPVRGNNTNDVLNFGISVARAIAVGVELVGEANGRLSTRGHPPIGTESRATMRLGSRYTRGPVRADGALTVGVTERDPTFGFTVGVTWVFKGFKPPER